MIFKWDNSSIQSGIIYFKFDYNDESWLVTNLNNDVALVNITLPYNKTYFFNFNEIDDLYELDTTLLTCSISLENQEVNIEAKNVN